MKHRPLGPEAVAVSAVGYGAMYLSLEDRPPEPTAVRVLHAAFDGGVTLVDTADAYCRDRDDTGHNERLIASALRSWRGPREHVIVATKGGVTRPAGRWEPDGRPAHLRAACDRSLAALGVERIDLYQLHAPDPRVPFEDSVGALADLRSEGKVRWVGLSNVSVDQIARARRIVPVTSVQNRLNPFFREAIDGGVVAYCGTEGLGFLAYSPTGGGRLNLRLPAHPVLAPMAARLGVTAHRLVLAWVLSRGASVIPIPSARTVEHVRDSIAAAGLELGPEDLGAIDRAEFTRA